MRDPLGLDLTGANDASAQDYALGLRQLQCFTGDPVAAVDQAIAASPGFVMGHVLKGYLFALSTESDAMAVARACHAAAAGLKGTTRERAHVAALGALTEGSWNRAGQVLAAVSADQPRDVLALQAGHQIDFFTGNALMLRDRLARALPAWDILMPGYHAVLGMQAFGHEEMGDYGAAERLGKRAVELEPRDGWAQHAVAHVMEMQCRQRDGIAWMSGAPQAWAEDSFLKVHNWWHLALFHYDLGQTKEVLDLYDREIFGGGPGIVLNLVDASAILWRLWLGGVDAGDRWQTLAQAWAPQAGAANYAFNDMHAMMAFVAAGRVDLVGRLLDAQDVAMAGAGDNATFTRQIGNPLTRAMLAFGQGDYLETVRLILPVRAIAHRFGGSHAQRDVIDLTLIEAAIRADDRRLAFALTRERAARRPASPLSALFEKRAASLVA